MSYSVRTRHDRRALKLARSQLTMSAYLLALRDSPGFFGEMGVDDRVSLMVDVVTDDGSYARRQARRAREAPSVQPYRQMGTTTRQMLDAPVGALYVWCNDVLGYPRALAAKLGRSDLVITAPRFLDQHRGVSYPAVVVDHDAVNLLEEEDAALLRSRVR